MCRFLCFDLFFSRPVELHVAGRQKKHRGSTGGLPRGSHPEDLQIPAAAEGECYAFQPCVVELPHPGATSAGPFLLHTRHHHPAISSARTDPFLGRGLLVPTHLRFTSLAAPHRSNSVGPVIACQTFSYSWNLKLKSRRNLICAEEPIFLVHLISAFLSLISLQPNSARLSLNSHQYGEWRCNNNKGVTRCSATWSLPAARAVPSAITHIVIIGLKSIQNSVNPS